MATISMSRRKNKFSYEQWSQGSCAQLQAQLGKNLIKCGWVQLHTPMVLYDWRIFFLVDMGKDIIVFSDTYLVVHDPTLVSF